MASVFFFQLISCFDPRQQHKSLQQSATGLVVSCPRARETTREAPVAVQAWSGFWAAWFAGSLQLSIHGRRKRQGTRNESPSISTTAPSSEKEAGQGKGRPDHEIDQGGAEWSRRPAAAASSRAEPLSEKANPTTDGSVRARLCSLRASRWVASSCNCSYAMALSMQEQALCAVS